MSSMVERLNFMPGLSPISFQCSLTENRTFLEFITWIPNRVNILLCSHVHKHNLLAQKHKEEMWKTIYERPVHRFMQQTSGFPR